MLDINGYTLYRNDRSWRENPQSDIKRGGGVGAYILSSHTITESDLKYLNTSNKDIESLWIKLITPKQKDIGNYRNNLSTSDGRCKNLY